MIYQASILKEMHSFYGDILHPRSSDSIYSHLSKISTKMYEGLKQKENCLYAQLNNYHPDYLGTPIPVLKDIEFDLADCQHSIANEYSFSSWNEVQALEKVQYNLEFEFCVNAIINGETTSLKNALEAQPNLILAKSQFGHKATLLHYTASNGVELWRQQVPMNLEEIIIILLNAGADKTALMNVYGGGFTTHELFITSAHPIDSGINISIAELLKI